MRITVKVIKVSNGARQVVLIFFVMTFQGPLAKNDAEWE